MGLARTILGALGWEPSGDAGSSEDGGVVDAVSIPIGVPAYPIIDLSTGEKVYPDSAERSYYSNAFRACLLAKARPVSSLPVDVYVRDGGVRRKADDAFSRALSDLLRHRWNPVLTGSEGIRWAMMTKDTLGNAFMRVEYRNGLPVAIWPMRAVPDVQMSDSGPVFDYPGDSFTKAGRYLSHEVIWVKSPVISDDGYTGVSLADLAARELGLSIDLEEFYHRLITNGNHFPGWLEAPSPLKKEDVDKLRAQLDDHKGIVGAGTVRIFDGGMTYHQTPLTMADMSLVDQERWILQQTCRTLSVPPQEVFELSNATYSNIEQGALNFATKTLSFECSALEQAFSDPLWAAGMGDHYVQIDMNGLLRGDYKGRMEGYRTAIMSAQMTPNEARAKEDEAPYEGGSVIFRPSAYVAVDPETGEVVHEPSSRTGTGYSGEGYARTDGEPQGRPADFAPVYTDMEDRVRERFRDKGDTPQARSFARKVLTPWALSCAASGRPYDIESEIERMARDA